MKQSLFSQYKDAIANFTDVEDRSDFLVKDLSEQRIYYAPFDYVNPKAKIFVIGITPGEQQMGNMLIEAKRLIRLGLSDEEIQEKCKPIGSFSGAMRKNLVAMMDHVGVADYLRIESTSELFDKHVELGNLTSAIRYPTFLIKDGKETNFANDIKPKSSLFSFAAPLTIEEIEKAPEALLLPLGPKVSNYLQKVLKGTEYEKNLLPQIPHPSGANAERIAYFLGKKKKEDLSAKTNPDKIDAEKQEIQKILRERKI